MRPLGGPLAIVCPQYPPAYGGVERYVERLAVGLVARGMEVEVLATDPAGRSESIEQRDGVKVRRFPTLRGDSDYFASPRLMRWLARHAVRYRLLHAHNLHTLVPVAVAYAARRDDVPLVITPHYHGAGHTRLGRLLHIPYRPVARWTVRAADRVVCNSNAESDLLRRHFGPGLPAVVVPEGFDLPDRATGHVVPDLPRVIAGHPGQEAPITIIAVGRLEAYKAVDRIVEALPYLPADHRLVVLGEGPARLAIERRAAVLGVAHRVVMRGRVQDAELSAWYASAAVSASLSQLESFGLTVLEAAAAGCPVVAADTPVFRETAAFTPPGRITLVDPQAPAEQLADALRRAILRGRTRPLAPEVPAVGWSIPSWDSLVDRTVRVYEGLIAERRPAVPPGTPDPTGSGSEGEALSPTDVH